MGHDEVLVVFFKVEQKPQPGDHGNLPLYGLSSVRRL